MTELFLINARECDGQRAVRIQSRVRSVDGEVFSGSAGFCQFDDLPCDLEKRRSVATEQCFLVLAREFAFDFLLAPGV
jgi:hypothetical protein